MQIVVVADMHANYRGLKAILDKYENADEVWCLGDIVMCGPSPQACTKLIRDRCRYSVSGNHDVTYVQLVRKIPEVCHDIIPPEKWHLEYLENLPVSVKFEADGRSYYLSHGDEEPIDRLVHWFNREHFEQALEFTGTDVIMIGHSHIAMIEKVGDKFIINPGTVGQPTEGDYRAQCIVIEDGQFRLDRVEYNLDELAEDYANSFMQKEHADYYLQSTRQGFVTNHGIRRGPLSDSAIVSEVSEVK
jgi:putative phosphoesterase